MGFRVLRMFTQPEVTELRVGEAAEEGKERTVRACRPHCSGTGFHSEIRQRVLRAETQSDSHLKTILASLLRTAAGVKQKPLGQFQGHRFWVL